MKSVAVLMSFPTSKNERNFSLQFAAQLWYFPRFSTIFHRTTLRQYHCRFLITIFCTFWGRNLQKVCLWTSMKMARRRKRHFTVKHCVKLVTKSSSSRWHRTDRFFFAENVCTERRRFFVRFCEKASIRNVQWRIHDRHSIFAQRSPTSPWKKPLIYHFISQSRLVSPDFSSIGKLKKWWAWSKILESFHDLFLTLSGYNRKSLHYKHKKLVRKHSAGIPAQERRIGKADEFPSIP